MDRTALPLVVGAVLCLSVVAGGCYSPYHADRGALFGGLTGAGVGALVGNAAGNTAAGAAIGAGLGAVTGATVGAEMDDMEARNRAMIEAQWGRQVAAGAVNVPDVVAMTRAGVNEELIINHVRARGMAQPLQTNDLIALQQQGVSTRVIAAMQEPPVVRAAPQPVLIQQPPPPPVMIAPYDPCWHGHCAPRPHWGHPHRPGVSWGVSIYD